MNSIVKGEPLEMENMQFVDFVSNPVLTALGQYYLRRKADDQYWDASLGTPAFVAARTVNSMTKIGDVQAPAKWVASIDTTSFDDGLYIVEIKDASFQSKNSLQEFEIKIGGIAGIVDLLRKWAFNKMEHNELTDEIDLFDDDDTTVIGSCQVLNNGDIVIKKADHGPFTPVKRTRMPI